MIGQPLLLVLFTIATSNEDSADTADLSKKIKAGDHRAFQTFYDAHFDGLLYYLMSKNTTKEAAKDIIQKAFIYIWEKRDDIDPDKSLKAYIFRIAYTRMLNYQALC